MSADLLRRIKTHLLKINDSMSFSRDNNDETKLANLYMNGKLEYLKPEYIQVVCDSFGIMSIKRRIRSCDIENEFTRPVTHMIESRITLYKFDAYTQKILKILSENVNLTRYLSEKSCSKITMMLYDSTTGELHIRYP